MSNLSVSRRDLLKSLGISAGAFALGNTLFGFRVAMAQEMADDDTQTVINLAATAELLATTHYYNAIVGNLGLSQGQVDYLKAGMVAEKAHYDLLVSLGAEPVVSEFYYPAGVFSDAATFAAVTEVAETAFVGAYLAATRIFAAAGATPFAVTTAQIAAVEETHRALARQIGGLLPNNVNYAQYIINNVSDAVPTLQPFLEGGDGFDGPVMPPTEEATDAIRIEVSAMGYDFDSLPYAAMEM
jgi:hypothetical protein